MPNLCLTEFTNKKKITYFLFINNSNTILYIYIWNRKKKYKVIFLQSIYDDDDKTKRMNKKRRKVCKNKNSVLSKNDRLLFIYLLWISENLANSEQLSLGWYDTKSGRETKNKTFIRINKYAASHSLCMENYILKLVGDIYQCDDQR